MERIAITGAEGQLGRALCQRLGPAAVPLDLPDFDVTDRGRVMRLFETLRPAAIINCAAYTLVDRAEQEPEICGRVNAEAVGHLADAARAADCPLVQISTDYVFGGDVDRRKPYTEEDDTSPHGVYARTKLEGERRALAWEKSVVVRTCGLYGATPRRNNFVETILRLAESRDSLEVVNDQECCPTSVQDLTPALLCLLQYHAFGLYHVVSQGSVTWCAFAAEILRLAGKSPVLRAITTAQFGARAPRPAYSVLNCSKYHSLDLYQMPHWNHSLRQYMEARLG